MNVDLKNYNHIRSGGFGFYEEKRGLIAVWGTEAVQFLDGMITNDMKTLEDGQQVLAAFPNAQGRLLAVVRIVREGERFLIETEEATREKVYQNLFRFTFAGDFFVEDLSEQYRYFEVFASGDGPLLTCGLLTRTAENSPPYESGAPAGASPRGVDVGGVTAFRGRGGSLGVFVSTENADKFRAQLATDNAVEIDAETYETLRIESGIPKFGVDVDETTIVPELGLGGMISYTKGCYIGQEIIARIHFRGHVAKQLTGLVFDSSEPFAFGAGETPAVQSTDGKNAGRITSVTYSPKLEKTVALAFVRFDYLNEGTELSGEGNDVKVKALPFV